MGTHENGQDRWVARRWAAWTVRGVAYGLPIASAFAASWLLTARISSPATMGWAIGRWLLIATVTTAVLLAMQRVTRRLMPLTTLFTLSLAFPDRVPSRFRLALRTGGTSNLKRRIEAARSGEVGDTPAEAAERLLELVGLLAHHDRLTRGHSERVRAYTELVGAEMGITGQELDRLRWAALLHDVGKIGVPASILNKPGRLTDDEFDVIKTHPAIGREMVEPLAAWLGDAVRAVSEHHERFEGGGYPQGLAGDEIALAARIVCVTDAFDVMTSRRSYKAPMSAEDARAELTRCAGTQFDPAVVRAFVGASIGSVERRTASMAALANLTLFPRSFLVPAVAAFGSTVVIGAGVASGSMVLAAADTAAEVQAETQREPTALDARSVEALDSTTARTGRPPATPAGTDPNGVAGPNGDDPTATLPDGGDPADPTGNPSQPPAPDTGVPSTSLPDIDIPNTSIPLTGKPDVTIPNGTVPGVTVPNGTVPNVTVPNGTVPNVTVPSWTIPNVTVPNVTVPSWTVPNVTVPSWTIPNVTVPPVTVPPVTVPSWTIPNVTVPPVTVPPVTVPKVTTPPITTPPVTAPPVTAPPVTVPPVTAPRVTVPPVTVPPVTVPPVTVPPVTVPPVTVPGPFS